MDFPGKRYLLFDLDGTIVDSQEGIFNGVRYAAERLGLERPPAATLRKFVGPALYHSFQEYMDLSPEDASRAVEFYREFYFPVGYRQCIVYPGMEELLAALRKEGRSAALATKKPEAVSRQILTELGLEHYFAAICGSDLRENHNDKRHILERAMEQLGVLDKGQALMIGDSFYDCEGARLAGIDSVWVLYGFGDEASMRAHGAAAIAASVQELRTLLLGSGSP